MFNASFSFRPKQVVKLCVSDRFSKTLLLAICFPFANGHGLDCTSSPWKDTLLGSVSRLMLVHYHIYGGCLNLLSALLVSLFFLTHLLLAYLARAVYINQPETLRRLWAFLGKGKLKKMVHTKIFLTPHDHISRTSSRKSMSLRFVLVMTQSGQMGR